MRRNIFRGLTALISLMLLFTIIRTAFSTDNEPLTFYSFLARCRELFDTNTILITLREQFNGIRYFEWNFSNVVEFFQQLGYFLKNVFTAPIQIAISIVREIVRWLDFIVWLSVGSNPFTL